MATAVTPPRSRTSGLRASVAVAATASAGAGLVHAAAVRAHEGDQLLVAMFALCAFAQVVWAVAAVVRPSRWVLGAGLIINGGALVVWALTRTVGIAFVGPLSEPEAVGTPDLAAALFAAASVLGAALALARPTPRLVLSPAGLASLAAFALVAALPAMSAGHTHDHGDDLHLHSDGHGHDEAAHDDHAEGDHGDADHATGEHAEGDHVDHADGDDAHGDSGDHADGHGHGEVAGAELVSHDHGAGPGSGAHDDHPSAPGGTGTPHDHPTVPGSPSHPHPPADPGDPHDHPTDPGPSGPIISLDDPRVTPQQRAIAQNLINVTTAGMAPFTTEEQVKAAGYTSIGDGGVDGYEHFVNWTYLTDAHELNPNRIESIVLKKNPGGPKTVVSAMYILSLGKTMANVPALAGPLTTWHDHQNLCFEGTRLVGTTNAAGVCTRGVLLPTPPMLHVWMVPHPCGPFAGIESHGGATCGHDGH